MKVEIQIDNNLTENKVIIQAKEMNSEISELIRKISNQKEKITVFLGEETYFINILYVYVSLTRFYSIYQTIAGYCYNLLITHA